MTLEQLKAFQAIVTTGTFTGAAALLNKAQPALSVMIKNLEEEYHIRLFSREGYRPALTAEGQVFYEKAVITLAQVNELDGLARRLSGEEEPYLRIAFNAIFPLPVLLPTLKKIDDTYSTNLIVFSEMMGGAIERVDEGKAELAVTTLTGYREDVMACFPLMSVSIVAVAHCNHPAAKMQGPLSTTTMRAFNQIIVAGSGQKEKKSLNVLQGVKKWVVTDIVAKKDIIMAGMGWGGLPEYFVSQELKSGVLVPLYVEDFGTNLYPLYVIRRKDKPMGLVNQTLWNALKELARGLQTKAD